MIVYIENGTITATLQSLPTAWQQYINLQSADPILIHEIGFRHVLEPEFNPATHRLGGIIYDSVSDQASFEILALSESELSGWLYPDRPFRFTVPLALLFSGATWTAFAIYADKKHIPYEELDDDHLRYYAQEILSDHLTLLTSAGITIESYPNIIP